MSTTQLIVIGGSSAVGKNTFINTLQKDSSLRTQFGIGEDVRWITDKKGNEVKRAFREDLPAILGTNPDTVVLKWQAFMKKRHFEKIIDNFPFVSATGLFLWLPYQVHVEQFFAKHRKRYHLIDTKSARARCQRQVRGDLKRFAGLRLPTVFVNPRTQTETEAHELWARLMR